MHGRYPVLRKKLIVFAAHLAVKVAKLAEKSFIIRLIVRFAVCFAVCFTVGNCIWLVVLHFFPLIYTKKLFRLLIV